MLARSTRVGVETPFGNTFMPQPGAVPGTSAGTTSVPSAGRTFFCRRRKLAPRFRIESGRTARPSNRLSSGRDALFINSLELRMPPPTLPFFQDNLSFVVFHDAGMFLPTAMT